MEVSVRASYEAKSLEIRADLKRFETEFAKKNGGKKPGRDDIKQNPIVASKYKKYNHVRDILSGKIPPQTKDEAKSRKRRSEDSSSETPSKRSKPANTPSKDQTESAIIDDFATPSARRLFSPAVPTSIGPTPQRDGRVLGLFDLLEAEQPTPSRAKLEDQAGLDTRVHATPSKQTRLISDFGSVTKMSRTPMSISKRAHLDTFLTPLKSRDGNANANGGKTPSTVSKLQFSTPAFLKRGSLAAVDENGLLNAPVPLRLPRKPLGRGLSSVVASLRRMEEDKLDDELDALHEMEDMENGTGHPPPIKITKVKEDILVPDSQGPQLLGGFDDEAELDSDPEVQLGRDGLPLKVFKKKGQKRTTRRVNMKPTRSKRPERPVGNDMNAAEDAVVPETQADPGKDAGDEEDFGLLSDSDSEAERQGRKSKKIPEKDGKKPAKEGKIQKAVKKVSAMAHQNFKRLKLKNRGAKGGPGQGSRFRRRR